MRALLLLVLVACVHRTPMAPALRTEVAQRRAAVVVQVTCTSTDMFEANEEYPSPFNRTIEWRPPSAASGVLVTDDHVLTAAHVVACPTIPTVWVTLSNGVRRRVLVVREDYKRDIALLQTAANEPFWHGVAPPVLGVFEYAADGAISCAEFARPRRARACGESVTPTTFTLIGSPGTSGAGVYDPAGRLIGIIGGPSHTHAGTRVTLIPEGWLP